MGAVLCILLPVFFGCNNSGAFIDPFIGIWKGTDGNFWKFNTDGTGGWASTEKGSFPDTFSFFVYAGQNIQTTPSEGSLVIVKGNDINDVDVTRYEFTITGKEAVLIPNPAGITITLKRVKGSPQALDLDNILIGEWAADWTGVEYGPDWSLDYRTDGTVKLYHHQAEHQFECGYVVRENILVIFGYMRFGGTPIISAITRINDDDVWEALEALGALEALEVEERIGGNAYWIYFRGPGVSIPWLPVTE